MEKTKKCAKCKKTLPTKEFPKDNRAKDKLWRFCRACESARKKAQRASKVIKAPTKPTKQNKKSKKGSAKKSALKIYFRTKCSMKSNVPGKLTYTYGTISKIIKKQHISIFLPRFSKSSHPFDELFSEIISHEYLHYLILNHVSIEATQKFDNLFGRIGIFSEIGDGLSK